MGKMVHRINRTLYVHNLPGNVTEKEVKELFLKVGYPASECGLWFVHQLHGFTSELVLVVCPRGWPSGFGEVHGFRFALLLRSTVEIPRRPHTWSTGESFVVKLQEFGNIVKIDLMSSGSGSESKVRSFSDRCSAYAFIEFETYSAAEDAVHGRHRYNFDGHWLKVEFLYEDDELPLLDRSSSYKVLVSGLPYCTSAQQLKDHMERAGDVSFCEVFNDENGTKGVVGYPTNEKMKYAIWKLNDSLFSNKVSRSYIRVKENSPEQVYSKTSRHSSR